MALITVGLVQPVSLSMAVRHGRKRHERSKTVVHRQRRAIERKDPRVKLAASLTSDPVLKTESPRTGESKLLKLPATLTNDPVL
jgi:hypothetical protein